MTPFFLQLQPGIPISEQIVFAAKRAILSGQMKPGDSFPSVRSLSKELKINPNTAHRAVAELIQMGLLAMHPGIGTVVTAPPDVSVAQRSELLKRQVEELAVDARRLGVSREELVRSIEKQYDRLTKGTGGRG